MTQVKTIINACDTGLARGLNIQLIAKLNRMVSTPLLVEVKHSLIDTGSDAVNPYLQPAAAEALVRAVIKRGQKLTINSCLRTTVQQHIIRRQFKKGLCGITAAALPGRSNHERGAAIDINNADDWRLHLEIFGWRKLGSFDPPHYDYYNCRNDISSLQISAFQMLWNEHNPNALIAVDGVYGNITASKIDLSPLDGW